MDFMTFFANYGLLILLGALLVFMFWSSSRRMKKQREEQAEKANQTVPGAEVLLQGGLYGTIVAFDPENLDQPAIVEIAPGVDIKVHSQAILRIITPAEADVDSDDDFDEIVDNYHTSEAPEPATTDETGDRDGDAKPNA